MGISMNLPIKSYIQASTECVAIFGDRIWLYGQEDKQITETHTTWHVVEGSAFNTLSSPPSKDRYKVQFDVWAQTEDLAGTATEALRKAMEAQGYLVGYKEAPESPEAKMCCHSFEIEFIVDRE